jgi:hypothetical protein
MASLAPQNSPITRSRLRWKRGTPVPLFLADARERISPVQREHHSCAGLAPYATVYGDAPGPRNADAPGFLGVGRR